MVIHILDITAESTHDKNDIIIKGIIAGMKCFKVNTRDLMFIHT